MRPIAATIAGSVPLVDDHEVRAIAGLLQITLRPGINGMRCEFGVGGYERLKPSQAMVADQIIKTPGARRLIDSHGVAASDQIAQNAPKEVGVPMIPARPERVGEVDNPHAAARTVAETSA